MNSFVSWKEGRWSGVAVVIYLLHGLTMVEDA